MFRPNMPSDKMPITSALGQKADIAVYLFDHLVRSREQTVRKSRRSLWASALGHNRTNCYLRLFSTFTIAEVRDLMEEIETGRRPARVRN
jgi:hypothetical protein